MYKRFMENLVVPDFQIIGAQKSGSTWLWEMLRQHPSIAFPLLRGNVPLSRTKESFFFSAAEEYERGLDYYYQRFIGLRTPDIQVVGESTTDYFFDRVLRQNQYMVDRLPTIPELITQELPEVKIFIVLRDPVKRAISAYYHHLTARRYSPKLSLREADAAYPSLRIVVRGYYTRYLRLWREYVPPERLRIYIFEEDIVRQPEVTLQDAFKFLGVNFEFRSSAPEQSRNEQRGWTHVLLCHHLGAPYDYLYRTIRKSPFAALLDWMDIKKRPSLLNDDLEFLQAQYLPERVELAELLQRPLNSWSYGL